MEHDPRSLVGFFVTEVGVRQAWPFLTFTRNDGIMSPIGLRLYIDTTCEVSPPSPFAFGPAEEPAAALPALLEVLNLTVAAVTVAHNADLVLGFEGDVTLRVSGTPSAWTTHDVWWLSDPRA